MRKSIVSPSAAAATPISDLWRDLERIARVEISSEDQMFPIEHALGKTATAGWRAAETGPQVIRLFLDEPIAVHRIQLHFVDRVTERSQEFLSLVEGPGGRKGGSHLNVVLTLARHPDLAIPYFQFGRYILGASTISGRLREIATLRDEIRKHQEAADQAPEPFRLNLPPRLSTDSVESAAWLLQRLNGLESESRSTWRDLIARIASSVGLRAPSGPIPDGKS